MKKGNYGLDAPYVVGAYILTGLLFLVLGINFFNKFYYASWGVNIGIIFIILGFYMVYGSKVGKYKLREGIIKKLNIKGDEKVLDVGCGRGLMLNGVAAHLSTGKAYGIDIWHGSDQSGNNKNAAMDNAKIEGTEDKIEIINADMRKMPFENESFDIIVSSLAIHNLNSDEERKKAMVEIARVAKKGCKVAILDLAHINLYKEVLCENGFKADENIKNHFDIFPSVKILYAIKK